MGSPTQEPVGGEDPHRGSALRLGAARSQRRSMKTESQMESSKRTRSGTTSSTSETGSTVGRMIANASIGRSRCAGCVAAGSRAEGPDAHEAQDEDGHLERDPEREQRQRDEREEVARPDLLDVQLRVVVDEELERPGQHDHVTEGHACGEEERREHDEHADDALRALGDGGREERPDLPEDERQHDRERRVEAHLERRRERLRDAERDERRPLG